MLQEEITQKTVMMSVNTSKLTARLLAKMINSYLNEQKKHSMQPKQGKQSVKELIGQNAGVSNIEITEGNIKVFRKAQAEIEKKNDVKAVSQKMFKVV